MIKTINVIEVSDNEIDTLWSFGIDDYRAAEEVYFEILDSRGVSEIAIENAVSDGSYSEGSWRVHLIYSDS